MHPDISRFVDAASAGTWLDDETVLGLEADLPLAELLAAAGHVRDLGRPGILSYSPKVFLPLTFLCRDSCHYCTFAKAPRSLKSPYMSIDEMVAVARRGAEVGCREALFTLGDQPELRYRAARDALIDTGLIALRIIIGPIVVMVGHIVQPIGVAPVILRVMRAIRVMLAIIMMAGFMRY